jgi:hypothetical protein
MSTEYFKDDRFPPLFDFKGNLPGGKFPPVYAENVTDLLGRSASLMMLWTDAEAFFDLPGEKRFLEASIPFGREQNPAGAAYLRYEQERVTCLISLSPGHTTEAMFATLPGIHPGLFPAPEDKTLDLYSVEQDGDHSVRFIFPPEIFGEATPFVLQDIILSAQADIPEHINRTTAESLLRKLQIVHP